MKNDDVIGQRLDDKEQEVRVKKRKAELDGVYIELEMRSREIDKLKEQLRDIRARLDDQVDEEEPSRLLKRPTIPIIPGNAETLLECAHQAMIEFGKVQGAKGERAWTAKMDAMNNIEAALRPLSTQPASFHLFDSTTKNLSHCIIWWKTSENGWTTMRWTLLLATSSGYEQNLGVIKKTNQNMKHFLKDCLRNAQGGRT